MLNGENFFTPELEYNVSVSGSTSASPAAATGVTGILSNFFNNDYLLASLGLRVQVSINWDPFGTDTRGASLRGLSTQDRTYAAGTDISSTLHFYNLAIYVEPSGRYRLKYASVEWKVDGAVEWTGGSFDSLSSLVTAPSAIPRIGVGPYLNGGPIVPIFVPLSPGGGVSGSGSYSGNCEVVGGFRWRDWVTNDWVEDPIALNAPGSSGSPGSPTGSTCYNVSIEYSTTADSNGTTYANNVIAGGDCWIWPNNPGAVYRMNDDYEAQIYRGSLGAWTHKVIDVVTTTQRFLPPPPDPGIVVIDNSVVANTRAGASEFLARVTNAPHVVEDPITATRYAPWSYQVTDDYWDNTERVVDAKGYDGMHTVGLSNLSPYNHAEKFITLWNTWFHPHGLYQLWRPPDTADDDVRWPINGTPADLADYWDNVHQQWIYHPALPSGDQTKRRVDVIAEPLTQSSLIGIVSAISGLSTSWWGVERFIPDNTAWLEDLLLDDETNGRWTFDGTGTREVTATRFEFSADSIEAEFDLSSFTSYPYMVPTLARQVALASSNWSNVASVKIEVEDATGKVVELVAAATSGGTWNIPAEMSMKWHTSLAQNLGSSSFLADTYHGVAEASADYSSAILGSETLAPTQHGSLARSYGKLRVTITKTNPALSATLGLITLKLAPRVEWHVRYESAHGATVLSENGPLFRTQTLRFFNYLLDTILSTPDAISELAALPTIGDWLCFRRVFLEAREAQDDLLPEALSYFVNNEEIVIAKHLWRNPDSELNTSSFIVQGDGGPVPCILNSYRAMPPLALFPMKRRTKASNWVDTGTRGQYMYSLVANRRNIITTADTLLQLRSPGNILTFETTPPDGWAIGHHAIATEGDETYESELVYAGDVWLKMRPWRGALFFPCLLPVAGTNVSYDVDYASMLHVFASIDEDGKVRIGTAGNDLAISWVATTIDAQWVCVKIDRDSQDQRLLLVVEDAESVKMYESVDRGEAFTLADTIGTGTKPFIFVGRGGTRHIFWHNEGEIKGQIRDRFNATIETTFTARAGVDDAGCAADEDVTESGERRVHLVVVEGGAVVHLDSDDGKTFT